MSSNRSSSLRKDDWSNRYNMTLDGPSAGRPSRDLCEDHGPLPIMAPIPKLTHVATIELLGVLPE